MLAPKKLKHRKPHRPDVKEGSKKNSEISFGTYGLKALTGGWIKAQQIEAARRVITRYTKRGGKVWIRIFPHSVISEKGSQSTMGGGKGVPSFYVAAVKAGTVMFELDGIPLKQAEEALVLSGYKLPVKCKFIKKD
jgi:large subunit ribosomal protein L16